MSGLSTTLRKSGAQVLAGDVQLAEGTNVTLTQTGNTITIASSGGGGGSLTSSDDSLTVASSDAIINLAHKNIWSEAQEIQVTGETVTPLIVNSEYDGTNTNQNLTSTITVSAPADNSTFGIIGINAAVTDTHAQTGTIEDATLDRIALASSYSRTADSDVDWLDGGESITASLSNINRAGAFTGSGHPLTLTGDSIFINNEVSYNNPSGSWSQNNYGQKITIQANGTCLNGTLVRTLYGSYISVTCGNDANTTATAYGLYIANVIGADTNYAVYSAPTAKSYFNGAIQAPSFQDLNGTDLAIDMLRRNT